MMLLITPLTSPIQIFTLIISIILVVPFISRKINVPPIFGLILAGLVIGPNGSGLLQNEQGVSLFSAVGLLYIMFLAGLEINMSRFLQSKNKSLFFGAATFFIPLSIGFFILTYFLHFSFLSALLVSSMFSTHTLLSYPIVSRLNITRRESVVITIGGTIITDTAVLILLTVITTAYQGQLNGLFWIQLISLVIVFVFLVLWGVPKISRWYFNTIQSDSTQHYVFVLVALFLSSLLAKVAGIEPIVGAFLSGLALNRVIPPHSPLMNRTVFIGNAIFIPFFLIGVGMQVDLKVLFSGFDTILLALVLITIAIIGKYLAATLTQVVFKYSKPDRDLIFGLSASHAAATIAVILLGYKLGIVDDKVLNGTILLILVTSMISSFATEKAARIVALEDSDMSNEMNLVSEKILVPVSNPDTFRKLIDVALLTRLPKSNATIFPLAIVNDDEDAQETVVSHRKIMEELTAHAIGSDIPITPITRVDINIPTGISRTVKELQISNIVMGWSGRSSTANYFFGNIIDTLLDNIQQMVMVVRTNNSIARLRNIFVLVPLNADKEIGFIAWVNALIALSTNTGGKVLFLSNRNTTEVLKRRLKEFKFFGEDSFIEYEFYPTVENIPFPANGKDLLIAIAARPSSLSYNKRQLIIPKVLSQLDPTRSFIILYPEQVEVPVT